MVLAMRTDAQFWDSLVFDGIDEVEVEAPSVEVVARSRASVAACPDCDLSGFVGGNGERLSWSFGSSG